MSEQYARQRFFAASSLLATGVDDDERARYDAAMHLRPVLLASLLLLSACGSETARSRDCDKEFWDGTIGICLPQGWIVMNQETLRQRGVPEDTVVAFQAEEPSSGQFPTVTVTKEQLTEQVEPSAYSEASVRSVTILPKYTLIDSTQTNIDGQSLSLHVFTAQPISDEPVRRFYQVSTVSDGVGYTVTATTPVAAEDALEKQVYFILGSTTFEDIGAAEAEAAEKN